MLVGAVELIDGVPAIQLGCAIIPVAGISNRESRIMNSLALCLSAK